VAAVARQGEWSRAFFFRRSGKRYVIRFSAYREDFDKDRFAWSIAAPRLPIPEVVEVGEGLGGFYAVTVRSRGAYLDDLDEAGLRRVLPSLFATLDAERTIGLPSATGYGVWSGDGRAPHASWRDMLLDVAIDRPTRLGASRREPLASSPTGTAPFDEAFAVMAPLVEGCPELRHLIHADLLNFNVLVEDDRISALLDWGSAMFGDFLYDLAWLSFWWPFFPKWSQVDVIAEAVRHYARSGFAVPALAERLRCYELHIGLEGMYYSAGKRDWTHLEGTAGRTLELARRPLP